MSKRAENKRKVQTLKKNSDFLDLRRKGQRFRANDWLQIHFAKTSDENLQVGVTTGRKVGSAVIRNRLKRWCLEYFRKNLTGEKNLTGRINILFRPQSVDFYKELKHAELDQILQKAVSKLVK